MAEPLGKDYSLKELTALFGGDVIGDADIRISRIASIESARKGDMTFITSPRYRAELDNTRASAVIVGQQMKDATAIARIVCENPYAYYAKVCALLNPPHRRPVGVHTSAQVSPSARIAENAAVGPGAVVDDEAEIGADVQVGAGCYVGRKARIGSGTILHANVTVYDRCVIGERGIVHSGAVIGADGFGMAMDNGRWVKIPQIGRVLIGSDVEVGANTTIDRGALGDTVIEDDVKMDNQVQVGHNCHIGEHTAIAGCVGIAGSARIGRYCRIGGAAMIHGHIEIADNVEVSGGTLVPSSISEAGKYTAVFPMSKHRDWIINASLLRNLKDLRDRIRALETRITRKRKSGQPDTTGNDE